MVGFPDIAKLYNEMSEVRSAMRPYMRVLANLVRDNGVETAVEFGVRKAQSTIALLYGGATLVSYDLEDSKPEVSAAIKTAAGDRWDFRIGNSLTVDIPECDLLLHDSLHNYDQVEAEMNRHQDKVRKFIAFHDTESCGLRGQVPGSFDVSDRIVGIKPAIAELVASGKWRHFFVDRNGHGMMILRHT